MQVMPKTDISIMETRRIGNGAKKKAICILETMITFFRFGNLCRLPFRTCIFKSAIVG